MTSDLSRPPTRLASRYPTWAVLALSWGVCVVVLIVAYILLIRSPAPPVALALVAAVVVAIGVMAYVQFRFGIFSSILALYWAARQRTRGDPVGDRRTADRDEIEAQRRLRRGEITRGQYERVVTYRKFVHGELSRAQYHAALRQIALEEEIALRRRPPPPAHTS